MWCSGLVSVCIGDGVKTLGQEFFKNCTSLQSVSIGANVNSIGVNAFEGCWVLETLTSFAEKAPTCGSYALYDIDKQKCTLYVPTDCSASYKSAAQWKDFYNIVEGTAGIGSVMNDAVLDGKAKLYDLQGHQLNGLQKGIVNVVRMSNGTVRKVMVK